MDSQELIRSITDLSRKDIQAITFRKGAKDYTWTIKLAAPVAKWQQLIMKIVLVNERLQNIAGAPRSVSAITEDLFFTSDEEIVAIEVNKYAAGNYGWEVKIAGKSDAKGSAESIVILEQCNQELEARFG